MLKRIVTISTFVTMSALLCASVYAQVPMTQDRLHEIILEVGSEVVVEDNAVRFRFDGADLLCISDTEADRMRIISPIASLAELEGEQLVLSMAANFHSVLDARYAVSGSVLYAAYIHPLSPLAEAELVSAISQVATARNTFGTGYTSGALVFGGGAEPTLEEPEESL